MAEEITAAAYKENGIINCERKNIEAIRAVGTNAAFIATVAAPGSPGMKPESQPADFFNKETNKAFYLNSANTNKKIPLDFAAVKEIISKPSNADTENDYKIYLPKPEPEQKSEAKPVLTKPNATAARRINQEFQEMAAKGNLTGVKQKLADENYSIPADVLKMALLFAARCGHIKVVSEIETRRPAQLPEQFYQRALSSSVVNALIYNIFDDKLADFCQIVNELKLGIILDEPTLNEIIQFALKQNKMPFAGEIAKHYLVEENFNWQKNFGKNADKVLLSAVIAKIKDIKKDDSSGETVEAKIRTLSTLYNTCKTILDTQAKSKPASCNPFWKKPQHSNTLTLLAAKLQEAVCAEIEESGNSALLTQDDIDSISKFDLFKHRFRHFAKSPWLTRLENLVKKNSLKLT